MTPNPPYQFTPVYTFGHGRDTYVLGLTYTVREGNDILGRLVQNWVRDGQVRILDEGSGQNPTLGATKAKIGGQGTVE